MSDAITKLTHDLRSPLSVVKSFLTAIHKIKLSKDMAELRAAAARNIDKIQALIEGAERGPNDPEAR